MDEILIALTHVVYSISYSITAFVACIDDITYMLLIYSVHDFGHKFYKNLCSKCDNKIYSYLRYQDLVNKLLMVHSIACNINQLKQKDIVIILERTKS